MSGCYASIMASGGNSLFEIIQSHTCWSRGTRWSPHAAEPSKTQPPVEPLAVPPAVRIPNEREGHSSRRGYQRPPAHGSAPESFDFLCPLLVPVIGLSGESRPLRRINSLLPRPSPAR